MTTCHSSSSVPMTNKTSRVKKHIVKVLKQKVTKWPKHFSFFFFRRTSSELFDSHDGFCTKQQHSTPSSAWPHCFFTTSKSHKVLENTHSRTTVTPFSSLVCIHTNHLATKSNCYSVELHTELLSLPCFPTFCHSTIPTYCYLLMFVLSALLKNVDIRFGIFPCDWYPHLPPKQSHNWWFTYSTIYVTPIGPSMEP